MNSYTHSYITSPIGSIFNIKKCKELYFEYAKCKIKSNTLEESFKCDKEELKIFFDHCGPYKYTNI